MYKRIVAQHRAKKTNGQYGLDEHPTGGEYAYESRTNRLKSVAANMGGESADNRNMSDPNNFEYDSEGNLIKDKSKNLEISYDWRGMPVEFTQTAVPQGSTDNELYKLEMKYDGSGRRISKTVWRKAVGAENWQKNQVTHYTGIGTEIRENYHNESLEKAKVVVNMPQGLGRYGVEDASALDFGGRTVDQLAGYIPNVKFEWYLKNHLGSTMLVYGTEGNATSDPFKLGAPLAAYDYRAFGEQLTLLPASEKFTENFTGKERDDEIALNYFGARYLDPMLGMWISMDPKRQFTSPYLYAGNGYNPIAGFDPSGTFFMDENGNKTEGEFVPKDFQGMVTSDELVELQHAIDLFTESPGNVETLMSMAKYTLNHNVETRYWYNSEGQNSFGCGKTTSVRPGLGSGSYIHVHNWRSWTDTKKNEGLSWSNTPGKDGDLSVSRSIGGIMGYEIRTGRIYYGNRQKMEDQFLLMQLPAGKVYDAQEYSGEMEDAR